MKIKTGFSLSVKTFENCFCGVFVRDKEQILFQENKNDQEANQQILEVSKLAERHSNKAKDSF